MTTNKLKEKIQESLKKGKKSQDLLLKLLEKEGYSCGLPTKEQDMYEHWDIVTILEEGKGLVRIDVKGLKQLTEDGQAWIELINVHGDIGWLYAPKLHTIAFERDDCFIFIRREDLIPIVEEKIKEFEEINGRGLCFLKSELKSYQRYSRVLSGRSDEMIKMPFSDFEHLTYKKTYK